MSTLARILALVATTSLVVGASLGPGAEGSSSQGVEAEPGADADRFFTEEVLPVLEARCFRCHGPDRPRVRGGLRMDGRAALVHGGDEGPAIDPHDWEASALVRRVRFVDEDYGMPPDEPLPEEERAVLEEWVRRGAPWPGSADPAERAGDIDYAAARKAWPFRPLERPALPADAAPDAHPIDAFVDAALAERGLRAAPRATDRQLVRRVHYDLLGLPPGYELVEAYANSDAPDKWEQLVDRLLDRREYAEHLATRWLDVVRYAESDGFEYDQAKPYAWRYRDWVVDAFDRDMPYDEFLAAQIAGDELDPGSRDAWIATGWYHLGPFEAEPSDELLAEADYYDDLVRVISEGFLGVTVGCARCHDHRFDPISQEDYYGLTAFVRNVEPYRVLTFAPDSPVLLPFDGEPGAGVRWQRDRAAYVEALQEALDAILAQRRDEILAERLAAVDEETRAAVATPAAARTEEQAALAASVAGEDLGVPELRRSLEGYDRVKYETLAGERNAVQTRAWFEGDRDWILRATERDGPPVETRFLHLGDVRAPGRVVPPRYPLALVPGDDAATAGVPTSAESSAGRRTALASWIASADNPLTARVMANRVWQGLFTRGIVPTPNDFGAGGEPASHPELLDWLAAELVEDGWSLKRLHRTILMSEAYRRSSIVEDAAARDADPANRSLWRQNGRRLTAEELHDAMLAVGGALNPDGSGRWHYPRIEREALAGASKPGDGWGLSGDEERRRRALYAHKKRGMPVPLLQAFGGTFGEAPTGRRAETVTPLQALTTWNGRFVDEAAQALAERSAARADARRHAGEEQADALVRAVFELALSRTPDAVERAACREFLDLQRDAVDELPALITVAPLVPDRLQDDYLELLPDEEFLFGPSSWTSVRGAWGNWYNHTRERDPHRGPATLSPERVGDGRVSGVVVLREGASGASLFVRARASGDLVSGVEVRVDAAAGEVLVLEHPLTDGPVVERARVGVDVAAEQPIALAVDLAGASLTVTWNGAPVVRDCAVATTVPGRVGLSARGGRVDWTSLAVTSDGVSRAVEGDPPGDPDARALQGLCRAILNLNEFVYVD